jgi:hypothetical protein
VLIVQNCSSTCPHLPTLSSHAFHPLLLDPPAGEWAEGDAADAALRAATPSSSSGYSLPSSSCPEEVSWPPLADAQLGSGSSDCYAAVNLMTMSAKQRSGSGGVPAPAGGLFSAAPAPAPFVGAGPGSSVGGTSAVASPALSGGTLGCATAVAASRPHSSLDVEQFNHDSMAALAAKYDGTAARHHKVSLRELAGLCVWHLSAAWGTPWLLQFQPACPSYHSLTPTPPHLPLNRPARRWCPWTWPTCRPACRPPKCWSWCA